MRKISQPRRGATALRSIHAVGVKSAPKTQRSQYLELYVLGSEQSRLVQELSALNARRETIQLQLDSLHARIRKLRQEIEGPSQAEAGATAPSQPIKMVDINY